MPRRLKWIDRQYQIYALIDPRDNTTRYVGMSSDVNYRLHEHLSLDGKKQGNKEERDWIRELQQLGLSPILQILETLVGDLNTYSGACEREYYWINKLANSGSSLFNVRGTVQPYSWGKKRNKNNDDNQSAAIDYTASNLRAKDVGSVVPFYMPPVVTDMYDFRKLVENMPATLGELARASDVHERSIMRMRDGDAVLRSTANKILKGLSKVYGQSFTLDNVTGINLYDR